MVNDHDRWMKQSKLLLNQIIMPALSETAKAKITQEQFAQMVAKKSRTSGS
jgi:hypothetical protein